MNHIQSPRTDDAGIESLIQSKGKVAPRVKPSDIDDAIASEHYFTAAEATRIGQAPRGPLDLLTFCVLVLRNGFTVTGESACASPENFDAEIGRSVALANAKQKIWPLLGFRLKDQLHAESLENEADTARQLSAIMDRD